VVEVP